MLFKLYYLICNQILQGLRDIDNDIVAATFKVMADCVLVLGAENVVGTTDRRIIFKEGQPDVS